jgi:hypothetical protein
MKLCTYLILLSESMCTKNHKNPNEIQISTIFQTWKGSFFKITKVSELIQLFENHEKSVNNECCLLDLLSIQYSGFSWTQSASSDQLGAQPATLLGENPTTVAASGVEGDFPGLGAPGHPRSFLWG